MHLVLPASEVSQTTLSPVLRMQTKVSVTMDWRHNAACLDIDPELFFPVGTTGPALDQIERAKAVCRACDVVAQCLEWALETNQTAGVWGGMDEDERRALRRSRQYRRRIVS
jgi:WhiB family transcriptional regulator, redox-sensing transcriptional regulator